MAYLTLVITIPLIFFALSFAIANSSYVTVGLWPLDQTWPVPLSVACLGMLGAGFFLGALFVWILYQRMRYRYWKETRRVQRLEKELDALQQKAEENKPASPPPTALPAR